jgi:sugar phosphate isomerase/epimerase
MQFGISTHLYHDQRLTRDHLAQIAGYGFEAVELFATRSHFDYHDEAAIEQLAGWLSETGLRLHSIHAPIQERYGTTTGQTFSTAAGDSARRQAAVREAEAALKVVDRFSAGFLVVHLGTPTAKAAPGDNSRAAGIRSIEEIARAAESRGARVAVEVIPNDLSSADALVTMLERDFDGSTVGLCMDFGHAHLLGDVADAIETAAEHLITTHVHDNAGQRRSPRAVSGHDRLAAALLSPCRRSATTARTCWSSPIPAPPAAVLEEARRARQRIVRRALTH